MTTVSKKSWLREWAGLFLFMVLMVLFRSSVADWYVVPTGSMKPNILEGDRVFVNKMAYDLRVPFTHLSLQALHQPKRGEIIVLDSPAEPKRLIKRVIGIPGDVIALRDNRLYVNGRFAAYRPQPSQPIAEVWSDETSKLVIKEQTLQKSYPIAIESPSTVAANFGPVKVPAGQYFVMGDNRDNSGDSRYFGFVPRDHILGRASHVVLSLNYDNYYLPRAGRYWQTLP